MKIVAGIEHRLKELEAMERIMNSYLSDLFFRRLYTEEEGYNREKLINEAVWFLEALSRLEVKNLPTADELVDDFLERV